VSVADIPGAQPAHGKQFVPLHNRPNYSLSSSDVFGATSKTLHASLAKPEFANRTDDIEGAQPRRNQFKTTRHVDPLVPSYSLPATEDRPPTPPKFMRDAYNTTDIAGTSPAPLYKWAPRDTMNVGDIAGTQSRTHIYEKRRGGVPESMDVSDITGAKWKTGRVTNPLAPEHTIHGIRVADDDSRMKPKPLKPQRNGPTLNLNTGDIEGANPGWKPKHHMAGVPEERRRHFREMNKTADIPGAAVGTLKRNIVTNRVVDPVDPVYPPLDGGVTSIPDTPFTAYAKKMHDPKDAEISSMRAQIQELKRDVEIARLEAEVIRRGGKPLQPTSSSSNSSRPPSGPRGGGTPASRASGRSATGSFASSTASSAVSRQSRSRGSVRSASSRASAQHAAEVAMVRDLPDTPVSGLARAGSSAVSSAR
jgi:hypothetical protein